jgi:hypothetical protein
MTDAPKIKIARSGKILGEFYPWEVCEKWAAGELSMTDDYWRQGMASWGKLQTIKEELITAKKPASSTALTSPLPPLPPMSKPKPSAKNPTEESFPWGTIVFIIGAVTVLSGLTGNPDGSAVRQGVLAQHMTNGILLMILGVLLSKR